MIKTLTGEYKSGIVKVLDEAPETMGKVDEAFVKKVLLMQAFIFHLSINIGVFNNGKIIYHKNRWKCN